ncbi:MAG: hypothetical protein KKE39_13950, partial [Bacteroidetes bacterium]|nr:hypothetical protein [Bacteroidota bacterium]MBU1759618.1 hypothetical protein [Bacteroidota bacterium]
MPKPAIHFFSEETNFRPKTLTGLRVWINKTIESENYQLKELNFIFCSDKFLLKINQEYLNHDTYTMVGLKRLKMAIRPKKNILYFENMLNIFGKQVGKQ